MKVPGVGKYNIDTNYLYKTDPSWKIGTSKRDDELKELKEKISQVLQHIVQLLKGDIVIILNLVKKRGLNIKIMEIQLLMLIIFHVLLLMLMIIQENKEILMRTLGIYKSLNMCFI